MIVPDKIWYIDLEKNKYYYTIIDNMLYYNVQELQTTMVQTGNSRHAIFNNSCMSHNFTPFKFKNTYFGIGGQDDWKVDEKWRGIDFKTFKEMWEEHFQKEYLRGEEFYAEIKYKFDTTPVYSENRGLYLTQSENGREWHKVKKGPIITAKSAGFVSSLAWKSAEFDGKPTVIQYKGKWIIYLRANVAQDRRHIQMATSGNLKLWSAFQLINIDYDETVDNYYHPIIFEYKRKLIGFFNYYTDDYCCVKIKKSEDGLNWTNVKSIFENKSIQMNNANGNKKIRNVVCHVVPKDDNLLVYMNHNYYGLNSDIAGYIMRYKISLQDFHGWLSI